MTQPSAAAVKPKRSRKALMIVGVVLAVIIVAGVLVSTLPSLLRTGTGSKEDVVAPKVEITSTNLRASATGEHIAYVDLSINNTGGEGKVIVKSSIGDGENSFYANQTITIKSQETMSLTLTFSDVTFTDFSEVHAYPWIELPEAADENRVMP